MTALTRTALPQIAWSQTAWTNTRRLCSLLLALSLALVVGGCALSPQQIEVQPVLPVDDEVWGRNVPVTVVGEDRREDRTLGSLGGVYSETSTITASNDIGRAVERAAKAYLAAQGFQVNRADGEAKVLRIALTEFRYDVPDRQIGRETRLTAVLSAELRGGGETLEGNYRSRAEYRSVTRPDAGDNTRWINQILSDTLQRLFADPKVREFLTQ